MSTRQNPHALVHRSPLTMNVAVPSDQHSKMFGQPASSQTVTSDEVLRQLACSERNSSPIVAGIAQPRRLALAERERASSVSTPAWRRRRTPTGSVPCEHGAAVDGGAVHARAAGQPSRDGRGEPVGDLVDVRPSRRARAAR